LTFLMVYVWARRNPHVRMSFLALFSFNAPYLPWVLLSFSVVLGNSATIDLIGIIVGHVYYFLEDVYPIIADIRGWRVRRWLAAPALLKQLFGEGVNAGGARMNVMVNPVVAGNALGDGGGNNGNGGGDGGGDGGGNDGGNGGGGGGGGGDGGLAGGNDAGGIVNGGNDGGGNDAAQ
jgi:hypothetical protein